MTDMVWGGVTLAFTKIVISMHVFGTHNNVSFAIAPSSICASQSIYKLPTQISMHPSWCNMGSSVAHLTRRVCWESLTMHRL